MELKHIAVRAGRLSSFLKEEMKMSAGLINRLKWQQKIFVNGNPEHNDFGVNPGDVITVAMDDGSLLSFDASDYLQNHRQRSLERPQAAWEDARSLLPTSLTVEDEFLALLPLDGGGEKLSKR